MKILISAIAVEGPTTQELKECNNFSDTVDNVMFAYATHMTEVFDNLSNLKNNKAVGNDVVYAEVLRFSLLTTLFRLSDFIKRSLSRSWFPRCLKDAKVYLLHKWCDKMAINKIRLTSIFAVFSKMFEKISIRRICFVRGSLVFIVNEIL